MDVGARAPHSARDTILGQPATTNNHTNSVSSHLANLRRAFYGTGLVLALPRVQRFFEVSSGVRLPSTVNFTLIFENLAVKMVCLHS